MGLKHISLKLDRDTFNDLKAIAVINERSVLAQVRWIVKQYIRGKMKKV